MRASYSNPAHFLCIAGFGKGILQDFCWNLDGWWCVLGNMNYQLWSSLSLSQFLYKYEYIEYIFNYELIFLKFFTNMNMLPDLLLFDHYNAGSANNLICSSRTESRNGNEGDFSRISSSGSNGRAQFPSRALQKVALSCQRRPQPLSTTTAFRCRL